MSDNTSILSHITLGTNNMSNAVRFYDALLSGLGFTNGEKLAPELYMYAKDEQMPRLFICTPFDGKPATVGNGTHIALLASSLEQVRVCHEAALANGGVDEGAPGLREHYGPHYYAAYVRDPDGNKLQVVCYAKDE